MEPHGLLWPERGRRVNNYQLQVARAKEHFLTYDQQEIIDRCGVSADQNYLFFKFLNADHRICRYTGNMERRCGDTWIESNGFGEVMTVLDWLCDSRKDRYITGRWINVVTHGNCFHRNLQEDGDDPYARLFDQHPETFCAACETLGGKRMPGADIGYAIELLDGLRILVQLWRGDEEFPPRLRCLWDENTLRYIRYETTWYAVGVLMKRIKENME